MWQVTAAANGVVFIAYSLISATILVALVRTRQLRTNPLGTATAAIFFSCAVNHGIHLAHLVAPGAGVEVEEGLALRATTGWHVVAGAVLSAAVALFYWRLRSRYGALLQRGPSLFADLKGRQRTALEINDNIVQGLALAQYQHEAGHPELAHQAVVKTLAAARTMMSGLVDPVAGLPIEAGDLVRSVPARPSGALGDRASTGA